jgi:hypothetical protein
MVKVANIAISMPAAAMRLPFLAESGWLNIFKPMMKVSEAIK